MVTFNITAFKGTLLRPEFSQISTIELESRPFNEGAFGCIYSCISIDGRRPGVPQVIKIFKNDGSGNDRKGFETVQKLQDKLIAKHQDLTSSGKLGIDSIAGLYAVPQFSFEGTLQGQRVLGYGANRLDTTIYVSFEDVLEEPKLQHEYNKLTLNQRLQYAYDLAETVQLLRETARSSSRDRH
jgi:hypothetical protein